MADPRCTVVLGFAQALSAPEVAWSLVDQGFKVAAFARKGRASAIRHSRHVLCHEITAPESDFEASLRELRSLLEQTAERAKDSRTVLLPLDDTAIWLCARLHPDVKCITAGPNGVNADLALNKSLQVELAVSSGFRVPDTFRANTADEVLKVCRTFPVILKPADCVFVKEGRVRKSKKWICADRSELQRAVSQWAEKVPLLIQPFIAGTGEGIFGIATATGVRAWSAHRRLRMMNPQGSGSSACVSQGVPVDLQSKVEMFIEKAKWRGLFMLEFLRDRSGIAWFVELNGRPWGSMALSRRQNLEYPAWHVELALDRNSNAGMVPAPAPGVVCRNVGRELMHLLFVLRGPRSRALREWPSFWRTAAEMLRFRTGDTIYNWRREDPKVFFADCYSTIHDNLFKSRA